MKILLHTCCGPCLLYPLNLLKSQGFSISSYFYNPNIHPFKEYTKRLNSLKEFSSASNVELTIEGNYDLSTFLHRVVFNEKERCSICYDMRLEKTASYASLNGFDFFTTTLLYSRYQNHGLIKKTCEQLSEVHDISFYYEDFRIGWQKGIDESRDLGLYRQPYCGCIYSEQERYDKRFKKK